MVKPPNFSLVSAPLPVISHPVGIKLSLFIPVPDSQSPDSGILVYSYQYIVNFAFYPESTILARDEGFAGPMLTTNRRTHEATLTNTHLGQLLRLATVYFILVRKHWNFIWWDMKSIEALLSNVGAA